MRLVASPAGRRVLHVGHGEQAALVELEGPGRGVELRPPRLQGDGGQRAAGGGELEEPALLAVGDVGGNALRRA